MELKDLKVGDLVIVNTDMGEKLATVSRITNTLIIVYDVKFRKSTGFQVGEDMWYRESISIPTEKDVKRVKKEMAKRKMTNAICSFSERAKQEYISFEELEKVYNLIVSLKK